MMDELQRQPEGVQADPKMVATVTTAVLQTLQATGNLPQGDAQSRPNQPEACPRSPDIPPA